METAETFNLDLPDAPPTARRRIKTARLFIGLGQTNQFLRGKKKNPGNVAGKGALRDKQVFLGFSDCDL